MPRVIFNSQGVDRYLTQYEWNKTLKELERILNESFSTADPKTSQYVDGVIFRHPYIPLGIPAVNDIPSWDGSYYRPVPIDSLLGTPTSGNILVGDGDSWESVPVTGDASIANTGEVTVVSYRRHFMIGD